MNFPFITSNIFLVSVALLMNHTRRAYKMYNIYLPEEIRFKIKRTAIVHRCLSYSMKQKRDIIARSKLFMHML